MSNIQPNVIKKTFEEQVALISTMSDVYLDEKQGFELYIAMGNALDYINQLEDEVERLKGKQVVHIDISEQLKKECEYEIKTAVSEAIKEFAERLKKKKCHYTETEDTFDFDGVTVEDIDSLVKEMVGDEE